MLRGETGKTKPGPNEVRPKLATAENPGRDSESSKFKVERESDTDDGNTSRVSSNHAKRNQRPLRRHCFVCAQLSPNDKAVSQELVNGQVAKQVLSSGCVSINKDIPLSIDNITTAGDIRTSSDISDDKQNKEGMETESLDPLGMLTIRMDDTAVMETALSLEDDPQEAGFGTGWEELNLSPTFGLAGQWRDPANEKEGMLREKSTKGGVSYYVNVEANNEVSVK